MYPQHLNFLQGVYEFNDTLPAFDLLAGSSHIRSMILRGCDTDTIINSWQSDESGFAEIKRGFHLYQ